MSLTSEGLAKRLWRGSDLLRELLGDTRVPDHVYGPTSVSANIFTDADNLLTLSLLVLENSEVLTRRFSEAPAALASEEDQGQRRNRLGRELCELEDRLRVFGSRLNHMADRVASLRNEATRSGDELASD